MINCFSDAGRLTISPEKVYKEAHNPDEIVIAIYHIPAGFLYSFNCKLGSFIHSYYPHSEEHSYSTLQDARRAACNDLSSVYRKAGRQRSVAKYFRFLDTGS